MATLMDRPVAEETLAAAKAADIFTGQLSPFFYSLIGNMSHQSLNWAREEARACPSLGPNPLFSFIHPCIIHSCISFQTQEAD